MIQGQLNQRKYKRQACTLEQIHLAQRGNAAQDLLDIHLEGADGELMLTFQVNAEKLALAEQRDGRYPILTNCWDPRAADILRHFKEQDQIEIVFTQMTKGRLFALGAGWDHVADLDLIVVNDDAVDQQFYQLPALSEIELFQCWRQALAEVFDVGRQFGHIQLLLGLRLQLSQLLRQPVLSLD